MSLVYEGRQPGIHRFESSGAWSRQSMLSSSSQLRSARSSLSSRISHYLPTIHGGSARSSITSPFCLPTPFSTRSNSPNNGAVGEVNPSAVDDKDCKLFTHAMFSVTLSACLCLCVIMFYLPESLDHRMFISGKQYYTSSECLGRFRTSTWSDQC